MMSNIDMALKQLKRGKIDWFSSRKEYLDYLENEIYIQEIKADAESRGETIFFQMGDKNKTAPVPQKHQWLFGCSDDFQKNVLKYDAKLRGRVLTCIMKILNAPITPFGDTIKPLEGDKKGLWRYREGDYRILYLPDKSNLRIFFINIESRGEIYK
jgi:mRNA-degrading endonuclease RelE of RelBE toxin-antitoxin system